MALPHRRSNRPVFGWTAFLFRLPTHLISPIPIYFVEVQGYKDKKGDLYPGFFGEIFLHLNDYRSPNDWRAILIFTERRFDPGLPIHYKDFDNGSRFRRIYLDQLTGEVANTSLELGVVQLIGVKKKAAPEKARKLIERARQELSDDVSRRAILELITTVFVYKFPNLTRQEIEAMLSISELKQTRVYQEALEEGREEGREELLAAAVPLLLKSGMTVEQIAEQLGVELEAVKQATKQQS